MALPQVAAFVRQHLGVVLVDVGRMDKNLQIPRHQGIDRPEEVPAVQIVAPTMDRLLDRDHFVALADARPMTPQALRRSAGEIAMTIPTRSKPR
jgi:hypothetical protein